jgi:hypothetical protein
MTQQQYQFFLLEKQIFVEPLIMIITELQGSVLNIC